MRLTAWQTIQDHPTSIYFISSEQTTPNDVIPCGNVLIYMMTASNFMLSNIPQNNSMRMRGNQKNN